jgi:hypothetical protein
LLGKGAFVEDLIKPATVDSYVANCVGRHHLLPVRRLFGGRSDVSGHVDGLNVTVDDPDKWSRRHKQWLQIGHETTVRCFEDAPQLLSLIIDLEPGSPIPTLALLVTLTTPTLGAE